MRINAHVLGIITLLIVLLFIGQDCSRREERKKAEQNYSALTDSVRYYKLSNGQVAAEKKSLQLTIKDYEDQYLRDKKEKRYLLERIGKLSNLTGRTGIGVSIKDTIKTTVRDTVYKGDTVKSFSYKDKFLTLNGIVNDDSAFVDYEMRAKLDIAYFTKKGVSSVNIVSDNPKLKITEINDVSIKPKKRFYQRNSFWLGVGALGTALLLIR